jgi:hypothetical protein
VPNRPQYAGYGALRGTWPESQRSSLPAGSDSVSPTDYEHNITMPGFIVASLLPASVVVEYRCHHRSNEGLTIKDIHYILFVYCLKCLKFQ